MSTRGSTFYDEGADDAHPAWIVEKRGWCDSCCVPLNSCGCPSAEAQLERLRAAHYDGMGVE